MSGRIESYLHSDNVTQNKGGSLVEVCCQTDFAAKTHEFIEFTQKVAKMAYAFDAKDWQDLIEKYEMIAKTKETLEKFIKEKIIVTKIVIFNLTSDKILNNIFTVNK